MKTIHLVQRFFLFLSLFGLMACAGHTTSTTLPGTSGFKSTVWILRAYGQNGSEQSALNGTIVTALFDSAQGILSGNSGCNSYSASYTTHGSTLTISELTTTMMACSKEIMQQERSYLKILQAAEQYHIHERELEIVSREARSLYFTVR